MSADPLKCDVYFDKREYSIVGDALYLRTIEETPPWLANVVKNLVDVNNLDYQNALEQYGYNLIAALNQLDIAKNTYDSYISKMITDEEAFVARLDTLHASVNDNDASIRDLLTTYATEEFATATAVSTLSASINTTETGSVGAAISKAESALATQYGALAQRLHTLESTYEFIDEDVTGTANAIQDLQTYTGYGVVGGTPALISESSFYTELNNQLASMENNIFSNSTAVQELDSRVYIAEDEIVSLSSFTTELSNQLTDVENSVSSNANSILTLDSRVDINKEGVTNVANSFFYNSTLRIGDQHHYSGFGLKSTGSGTGTETDPFTSEFWINANKLKFTNDNGSGSVYPFTIDASGTIPQVTFDGIVKFSNVEDVPTIPSHTSQLVNNSGYVLPDGVADAINDNTTTINGSKITTGSIHARKIDVSTLVVDTLQIADQAVTFPVSSSTATETLVTAGDTWTTIHSLSLSPSGGKISVTGNISGVTTGYVSDWDYGRRNYVMRVIREKQYDTETDDTETVIWRIAQGIFGFVVNLSSEMHLMGFGMGSLITTDTPGPGDVTYRIQIKQVRDEYEPSFEPLRITHRALSVIELKR